MRTITQPQPPAKTHHEACDNNPDFLPNKETKFSCLIPSSPGPHVGPYLATLVLVRQVENSCIKAQQ